MHPEDSKGMANSEDPGAVWSGSIFLKTLEHYGTYYKKTLLIFSSKASVSSDLEYLMNTQVILLLVF